MLLFGHAGITVGIMKGIEALSPIQVKNSKYRIDYGVVILGALLPDIIDKPVIEIANGLNNHSGHYLAHTYWFALVVAIIGILVFLINGHLDLLILGFGSVLHIFMDDIMFIINKPFDAFFGKGFSFFPKHLGWVNNIVAPIYDKFPYFKGVVTYFFMPSILVFEILGVLILFYYGSKRVGHKSYGKARKKY